MSTLDVYEYIGIVYMLIQLLWRCRNAYETDYGDGL